MESAKFKTGGTSHVTDNDGGNDSGWYEVGSNLTLFNTPSVSFIARFKL